MQYNLKTISHCNNTPHNVLPYCEILPTTTTNLKAVGQIGLSLLGLNFLVIGCLLQLKVPLCLCNLNVVDVAGSKTLFFRNGFLSSHQPHFAGLDWLTGHLSKDLTETFWDCCTGITNQCNSLSTLWVKKNKTTNFSHNFPKNVNWFSKFIHWQTQW